MRNNQIENLNIFLFISNIFSRIDLARFIQNVENHMPKICESPFGIVGPELLRAEVV